MLPPSDLKLSQNNFLHKWLTLKPYAEVSAERWPELYELTCSLYDFEVRFLKKAINMKIDK
ncbi:hypothetical protein VDG1235_1677 [Verrucomicrobiia bacterium DG1235]|nr:hypothetical protein VDG1235_1677 [Verrucomicrobiae bacterium DG1235]